MKIMLLASCSLVLLVATSLIANSLNAQDDLRSDIDPFAKPAPSSSESADTFDAPVKKKRSLLPKLSFGKSNSPRRPSMLQKMNRSTKQMMRNSRDLLMKPFAKKEEPQRMTGMKTKPKEKSAKKFFANLLKPFPDEPEPITTANDWFAQPRPKF